MSVSQLLFNLPQVLTLPRPSDTASPDDPNEISFTKGEILDIVDKQGKWWQAKKADGTLGSKPASRCHVSPELIVVQLHHPITFRSSEGIRHVCLHKTCKPLTSYPYNDTPFTPCTLPVTILSAVYHFHFYNGKFLFTNTSGNLDLLTYCLASS